MPECSSSSASGKSEIKSDASKDGLKTEKNQKEKSSDTDPQVRWTLLVSLSVSFD